MKNGLNFFLWGLIFVVSQPLFSMKRARDLVVNQEKNDQALIFLCSHYFGHQAIHAVSQTCTAYRNYIHKPETVEQRKNEIIQSPAFLEFLDGREEVGTRWHKNGTACCDARMSLPDHRDRRDLMLGYYELQNGRNVTEQQATFFRDFISPLPHRPAPFLNEEGTWSVYGYGESRIFSEDPNFASEFCQTLQLVLHYSLNDTRLRCLVTDSLRNDLLVYLLQFLVALKAVLSTEPMFIEEARGHNYLAFSLKHVVLPDNYKQHNIFSLLPKEYQVTSFGDLPDYVKEAIEEARKNSSATEFIDDAAAIL